MITLETVKELLVRILKNIKQVNQPYFDVTNRTESILEGLIKNGYVIENNNKDNGVIVEYELTEKGKKYLSILESIE